MLQNGGHVLVTTPGQADDHQVVTRQAGCPTADLGQCMGGLQRRDDAFLAAAQLEGLQRFAVGHCDVFDPALLMQPGVLGADTRVVQTGGNRMGIGDLAILVLQQVGAVAVQNTGDPALQAGSMELTSGSSYQPRVE